jgi:hypothetical protein
MRMSSMGAIVGVVALALSSIVLGQDAVPELTGVPQRPTTLYNKLDAAGGKAGPAPRRDLSGSWTGPLEPLKLGDVPALTPLGQQRFKLNIPDPFRAHSNDPWGTCDPFGFPRSTTNETRGVTFAPLPDRLAIMTQYGRIWRTVWMDGRDLPKNVGAKGGPDPRWYGYSVGHWEGDYTRVDHDALELTVTVDDPKIYTKPFVAVTNRFKWIPNQEDEEQFCVPSEMIDYIKIIALPAGQETVTGQK